MVEILRIGRKFIFKKAILGIFCSQISKLFKKILPDFLITLQEVADNIEGSSDFYYFNNSFIAIFG